MVNFLSSAAEQALQNPDLQIYEIPLDSVIHNSRNSIYSSIGGKRVAPRRETSDSVKRKSPRKESAKQVKKKESRWQCCMDAVRVLLDLIDEL